MSQGSQDEFIEWDDERYSTHIDRFDEQHQRLFALLNDLHGAMEAGESDEKVGEILRKLEEYTEYHFGDEEEFMQDCGYAMDCSDCFFDHREMHGEFANKVTELREKHENGEYITMEVLMFARDWLDSHIAGLNQDQNYGEYFVDEVPEDYEYEPGTLKKEREQADPHGGTEEPVDDEVTLKSDIYEGESLSVPDRSMASWLSNVVDTHGSRTGALVNTEDGFETRSVEHVEQRAREVAAGLLDSGLEPGDRVGIRAEPRLEWHIADLACYLAGLIPVPVSQLYSEERVAHVIRDADPEILLTDQELPEQVAGSVETLPITEMPTGEREELPGFDADPDDIATIVYRIGTTEHPRGCAVTHRNLAAGIEMLASALPLSAGWTGTCFLPPAHMYQRVLTYYMWDQGAAAAYIDPNNLIEELNAIQPELLVGVPQVYEQLHEEIQDRQDESGGLKQALSSGVARSVGEAKNEGRGLSTHLSVKHAVANRTVFASLREQLGLANIEYALTGTEAIDTELLEFFRGFDVPLSEIYEATELSGLATLNEAGEYDADTAGAPLPGTEIALADDDEILVRGPNVIDQYWNDTAAWRETLRDGWYHTGDLGRFNDEGALEIRGPK